MARLYSLSIVPLPVFGSNALSVDTKLNTLGDWIRLSPTQWFVWTDRSKSDLVSEIQATLVTGEQFIIVAVQPEFAQGFAPGWMWTWLNDKMAKQVIGP